MLEGPLQQEGLFCLWCKSIQGVLILLTRSLTGGVWEAGSISNSLSLAVLLGRAIGPLKNVWQGNISLRDFAVPTEIQMAFHSAKITILQAGRVRKL